MGSRIEQKLEHHIKTKCTLFMSDDTEKFAQIHELVLVQRTYDFNGDEIDYETIDYIDEFWLSDYESGRILDHESEDIYDFDFNGYSENWSGVNDSQDIDDWNEYKKQFK